MKKSKPCPDFIVIPLPKGQKNYSGALFAEMERKRARRCKCKRRAR